MSGMRLDSGGFLKQVIWKQRYDDVRQQSLQMKAAAGRRAASAKLGLSLRCLETHRKLAVAGGIRSGDQKELRLQLEAGARWHGVL